MDVSERIELAKSDIRSAHETLQDAVQTLLGYPAGEYMHERGRKLAPVVILLEGALHALRE